MGRYSEQMVRETLAELAEVLGISRAELRAVVADAVASTEHEVRTGRVSV